MSKIALITGASRGLGREMAIGFAEAGIEGLTITAAPASDERYADIRAELYETKLKVEAIGSKALCVLADVTSEEDCAKAVTETMKNYGALHILVNNAGIAHVGNIENCQEEDLDRLYNVNIKGVYNCSKAVIPFMKKNKNGLIINLASIASSVGISDRFAYSMTKGAVLTMTYSIAKDYVKDNIRCNCISPARVHTPFVDGFIKKNYPNEEKKMFKNLSKTQPIGRMGTPQEIADLALYLCSEEAKFITGSNFAIDGGFVTLNSH